MVHAYAALSSDIIMEYSFAECSRRLDTADFGAAQYELMQKISELTHT